jgi:hypothetical protein
MADDFTISSPPQHAAHPPVELTTTATTVLATIPTDVKPILLSIDFPHIVNKICELWTRPILLDRYFEELTVDARGGRKGFPLGVALEIANLREHYQTKVRPLKKTTWDMSI